MALLLAVRRNRVEIVELLLSIPESIYTSMSKTLTGSNVNLQDVDGWTALMFASYYGYIKIVKLLISIPDFGVNLQSKNGWTALMIASSLGNTEIVELLLSRSEINIDLQNAWEQTALEIASRRGYNKIVSLLENHK